jgi:hypothetical protein
MTVNEFMIAMFGLCFVMGIKTEEVASHKMRTQVQRINYYS